MSADKPEVGDVWLNEKGLECHLFGQIGSYKSCKPRLAGLEIYLNNVFRRQNLPKIGGLWI